ncbi:transcriptional repressor LexA [Nodosilinea sp. PGN35]|uniref:transcriptional repressor LexA n=1 Tax=Nodosilinea sp. PGN35 TaxID=3020489 RepID=UPI0023B2D49D|nr:transcriptional repressor LexA [Nodosilinea sp. TSF1-S3]MDF0369692.1 transcriptional repressor LexA [Nodosilinea sp. TSF1-S3]
MSSLSAKTQACLDWIEAYVAQHQTTPSYRQIMQGMGYKSISAVQHHLDRLEEAGFIARDPGLARTIRLLRKTPVGIPIYGAIAASSFVEVFPDQEVEYIEPCILLSSDGGAQRFALRVRGDSMIGALIDQGDIVVLERPKDPKWVKNDTIVAARVEGKTTLKRWHREGNTVFLKPENPNYPVMEVSLDEVVVEGVYRGIIRGLV